MITVRFSGGLGNQMYQYLLYIKLKKDYPNVRICADITDYIGKNYHQGFELERIFRNISLDKLTLYEVYKITGRLPIFYGGPGKEIVRKWRKSLNRKFFYKRNGNVIMGEEYISVAKEPETIERLRDDNCQWYIDKFYPPIYFFDDFSDVTEQFEFVPLYDDRNVLLCERIKGENSVSIHVRRGDYVGTGFDILTERYYLRAIDYINSIVSDAKFYVFSDDEIYVKKMFKELSNINYVTHNKGKDSFRDMQLMSMCKHNIIANSTFSLWGALLNKNEDKFVVYPSKAGSAFCLDKDRWVGIE